MGNGADAHSLPTSLAHLYDLGASLVTAPSSTSEEQLHVYVTVPTMHLAIATAALGARSTAESCSNCLHANLTVGSRVAVYRNRVFEDTALTAVGLKLKYGGVTIPATPGIAHRLPEGFPKDRASSRVDDQLRNELAAAYTCSPSEAGYKLLAASAHPVLIIGEPARYVADLSSFAKETGQTRAPVLGQSGDLDQWYRRPVLTTGLRPKAQRTPWLRDVRPRLVITTTAAAARVASPWPDVSVLSLLSRRSPSSVGAADLLSLAVSRAANDLPDRLARTVRAGNGLEIMAVWTPRLLPETEEDSDEFEAQEDIW